MDGDTPNETYNKPKIVKITLKHVKKGVSQGGQNKIVSRSTELGSQKKNN